MSARVSVDPDFCMGARMCERTAPGLFAVDDNGIAHALRTDLVTQVDLHAALDAGNACPSGAIQVDDA